MIRRILGFDISSSCTGYCLLEWDTEKKTLRLDTLDHYCPIAEGSILERLQHTRDRIADIINRLQPTDIAIEDIITFMPKRSSANTIIILALFNRMIGLLSRDYLGKDPILYGVMEMRRGLQDPPPEKEAIPDLIAKHLKMKFPWQYGPKGGLLSYNFDRADAAAVALFHTYVLSGVLPPPTAKIKKPKKIKVPRIKRKRKIRRK